MNRWTPEPDVASMRALLQRQRLAWQGGGPPSLAQRKDDLRKLKALILTHQREIEDALVSDFGHRARHETAIMELLPVVNAINHQLRHLRRWMRPQRRHVPLHFQPAQAWVMHQPLGVVGIMAPWNYPLSLALLPLATALAAGNRVMIKPSEFTPASSELLLRLLHAAFEPEQVSVVCGGTEVAQAFATLAFDHLVFTGSTEVGRAVMRAASEHLVPLTLELGGKSPALVGPGSDLAHAAACIAHGKLANGGQICIAPDYVLLHEADLERFVAAYDQAVKRLYPQGPASPDFTSVLNARHHVRLLGLIEDARLKGADVVKVGHCPERAGDRAHTLAPTLLLRVGEGMRVAREEIFGPVLPVWTYRAFDDALGHVNDRPRPLALYYFGQDKAQQQAVLTRTTSGNVTINNTLMHYAQDDLPFGGVGPSGMGAYHGEEGFKALSHAKGIYRQGRWNMSAVLRPPFGPMADAVLRFMMR